MSDVETIAMQRHLAECEACARHDTAVRRGMLLLRNLPDIEPSADFRDRLNARLRETRARDAVRRAAEHLHRAPGLGLFAGTAVGLVAASLMAATMLEWNKPARDIMLPPVLATRPIVAPVPVATPNFVASVPAAVPVWPAALMVEQAPEHFVTQFRMAAWNR